MADSTQPHFNPNAGSPRLPNGPPGPGMMQGGQQFPGPVPNKAMPVPSHGGFPGQMSQNMRPMMGNTHNPLPPSLPPMGGSQTRPGGQPPVNNFLPPNSNVSNGPGMNMNGFRTPPPSGSQGFPPGGSRPPVGMTRGMENFAPTNPNMSMHSQGGQFINGPVSTSGNMPVYSTRSSGPPPTGTPASSLPGGFSSPPNSTNLNNMASPPQSGIPLIQTSIASGSSSSGVGPPPPVAGIHQFGSSMGPSKSIENSGFPAQGTECPGDLPVPFHGLGQYSHQVGMKLTPGLTTNSEPTSQKSSRGPSPLGNPCYDALEGQFVDNQSFTQQNTSRGAAPSMTSPSSIVPSSSSTAPPVPGQSPLQTGVPVRATGGPPPTVLSPSIRPGAPPLPMSGSSIRPGAPVPPMSGSAPPRVTGPPAPSVSGFSSMTGAPPPPMSVSSSMTGVPPPPMSVSSSMTGVPPPPMSGYSGMTGVPTGGPLPPMSALSNTSRGYQHPVLGPSPRMPGPPPVIGAPPSMNEFSNTTARGVNPPHSISGPPLPAAPPMTQDMNRSTDFGQQFRPMGPPPGPMSGPSNIGAPPQRGFGGQGGFQQPTTISSPTGGGMQHGPNALNSAFNAMGIQETTKTINLLQEKRLIPSDGVETMKPRLPHDYKKVNCSPEVFRCTLTSIPQTSSILNKCRLPLGILIHPFKDLSQLPVIQSSVIVRCRSCRTYINPFVSFVDQRRWKCNLCYRINELPDEFQFDPVSKTYGDPQRRPEIKSATIEFIAPTEYMLRPPPPAVYLFVLDVSFNALETGYLRIFCQTMLDELDKIPKDSRTQIGFIVYDRAVHFFNLASGLSQPQMLIVSDLEDIFLPCPDDLLVNLQESRELVIELLNQMPNMFEGNLETGSALGAALQAAFKLLSPSGGRVTVMQTVLPTVGPGALAAREDVSQRSAKNVSNLGPATDFYKKLALDCSAQQIAVDLFMFNGQYGDMASVSCISKYSGGCVQYFPSFHAVKNRGLADKFEEDLRRYLTRKIGLEAVMRIRCTKGLSIHTFHGNFFVRSTDLLSLPNINPDAGFGMQMSIEDNLTETSTACFQAALLYTSSKGERRIRVHTMCLPVTNQVNEVLAGADQRAIVCLLAKMAVDRSVTSSMSDAREALINAAIDSLSAFGSTLPSSQRMGGLPIAFNLRLLPAYILAMLKFIAFRHGVNTRLDDRVFAMQQCKSLPLEFLMMMIYPNLYPVHNLDESNSVNKGDTVVCQAPLLHLSSANIDRYGVYLMDTYEAMYLYVGSAVSNQFCEDVFDVPDFTSIPEGMIDLPELDNPTSEKIRTFISNAMENRPGGPTFLVIREDSKHRVTFFQHMIEDRTESAMSYYEFLQHLQKQIKS